jgi:hypothetical protein
MSDVGIGEVEPEGHVFVSQWGHWIFQLT